MKYAITLALFGIKAAKLIFVAITLNLTRGTAVSLACGDSLWDMIFSTLILHMCLLPVLFVYVIRPLMDKNQEGGDDISMLMLKLACSTCITVPVFVAEIYYTTKAYEIPNCIQALNNATGAGDPLLTTAGISFAVYDGMILLALTTVLCCMRCLMCMNDQFDI